MAGQAHRGSRDLARSCHRGSSSARRGAPSEAGHGAGATSIPVPATTPTVATLATHRALLREGLTVAEATSLTAFLCGIPLHDVQWSLAQVNRLLFVRELHRSGRIGEDAAPAAVH